VRPLTTDLSQGDRRPYFLWDEDISVDELRGLLRSDDEYERHRLLGKMLREARDIDVWEFVTPLEVARVLPVLGRRLGRRRAFWEFLIEGWRSDGAEGVVVDLVWERVAAAFPDKNEIAGITVDPIDEILVNKITTIVSRAEERDLIDLLFLERAGYPVERGLSAALEKDGGCTPATLAWVLSELSIPDSAKLPAGVSAAEMRAFIANLIVRLRHAAAPPGI
jgi:hypothetical protein